MPAIITELRRVFRPTGGGADMPDPDPSASPERALELLALTDPALNNAVVEPANSEGQLLVYPVKINLGNKGFTLVEFMIVIVIGGLLTAMAIPAFQKIRESQRTPQQVEASPVTKVVVFKAERIERAPNSNQPLAVTRYYLVAGDGTGVEVKLSEFARAEVGATHRSDAWRNVD